ncbi:MAG: hypothetical protein C4576_34705 [Desulfobacteraceae bacterium]|nr:MAG: hypothetical protein C4576_34705 [Desulfobacteraceae bacterium]
MKGIRRGPTVLLVCSMFFWSTWLSGRAMAANQAVDMKVVTADGRTRVALLLLQKPLFRLSCDGENQVALSLSETVSGVEFGKAIEEEKKSIVLEEDRPARSLKLKIPLKGPVREVECSWIPKEKVLLIDMAQARELEGAKPGKSGPASLSSLRFGTGEGYTRMAAALGKRPAWSMTSREDKTLLFELGSVSTALQRSGYGPMRILKSVSLSRQKGGIEIKAEPETPVERVRVFWLQEGARWVVDFFERAQDSAGPVFRFERKSDRAEVSVQPPRVTELRKEPESPITPEPIVERKEQSSGSVRMKIEKPSADSPKPKSTTEPGVSSDRPIFPEAPMIANLRPAEAFLYGRIREALEARDYDKGANLIDEFVAGFPDSTLVEDISFLGADCRFALLERGEKGLYPKVVGIYREVVSRYPKSEKTPQALVRMGRAHELGGNDHEAIGILSIAVNQYGAGEHVPAALVSRGRIYLKMNNPQRAIEDFKSVVDRFPASTVAQDARYGIAGYYHGVGMYDEAEAKLKDIADSDPAFYQEHPEFLFLRARNFFYKKEYDLAREQYFRALNLGRQPESGDLLISHIGDTFLHQTREKEAEVLYRMAMEYFPESEGAGIARLRIADRSPEVSAYEEVHQKNIDKPIGDLALLEMAGKFYKKGQYIPAVETLKKLLAKTGQSDVQREARQLFFRCAEKEIKGFYDTGSFDKVIQYFQTADPGLSGNIEPEITMMIGDSFFRGRQFADAVQIFSQITPRELNPASRGKFLLSFAKAHLSLGDEEKAKSLLESASGENLPAADAQRGVLLLAEMYRKKGELKRASELLQTLLGEKRLLSDREMAAVYQSLGEISNKQSRYEKARDALNRSIALAEKDRESKELLRSAYVEMGHSYHSEGRHKEAIKHYGQSLDLDYAPEMKGYWEVKYKLALSYLGAGESALASRLMNEILEEGDPALQQKVQMKLGFITLEKELKRLPLGKGE